MIRWCACAIHPAPMMPTRMLSTPASRVLPSLHCNVLTRCADFVASRVKPLSATGTRMLGIPGRQGRDRRLVKITAIEVERLRLPLEPPFIAAWDPVPRTHFDATLVRVRTDEGITGYGSGDTMAGFADYADLFIGRDPLQIAAHVRILETIAFHAGRYWPLEAALWDIAGKACGQPTAILFGGALTEMPCYASFGEARNPAERADAVLGAGAAGFRAVKIRIGRDNVAAGLAAVRAARDAAGDDLVIMVDLNQW